MTAGEGLLPKTASVAIGAYLADKRGGLAGRKRLTQVDQQVRQRLAQLLGSDQAEIGLLPSASAGIAAVHALINWQPGDNLVVLTSDLEFPSVVIPAHQLVRERGVELRVVGHDDWTVAPEAIAAAVDDRTRLISVSHVSYRTGYCLDLQQLRAELGDHPAMLLMDATQSLGVIPVPAACCDFLVASSCKWLMAPHGIGVFYWNRERQPDATPRDVGWYSVVDDLRAPYELKPGAERFELGSPSWATAYVMTESLKIIEELGIEHIEQHVFDLGESLLDGLDRLGIEPITPRNPKQRAGIVSWLDDDPAVTAERLAEQGIWVTGSAGRIRASFHLYNSQTEIEALVKALETCCR